MKGVETVKRIEVVLALVHDGGDGNAITDADRAFVFARLAAGELRGEVVVGHRGLSWRLSHETLDSHTMGEKTFTWGNR